MIPGRKRDRQFVMKRFMRFAALIVLVRTLRLGAMKQVSSDEITCAGSGLIWLFVGMA